ncbi:MAG: glycerophosphodiester phosphodiesterase family protein [Lentimicrobium sp.]|jgi:glycerophosphoryl diester phosphodiesterase|nr:glycerophosphodiester phosphodiesterase family protein [Lentimicrobium sp.]
MRLKLILLFLFTGLYLTAQTHVDSIINKLNNPNLHEVLVVAHRGDWRNFPENSIEAIESAVKMGVDIVEIDIQRTKDGHLILMHDKTLDRTTTGKGHVEDWTLDSIKTLKLKNGCAIKTKHEVPTLEEALLYAKGKIMINLDKADRYFDEVYLLLEKTGTTHQIIMKGRKSPEEVKKQFGKYLDKVIYMPVVDLDDNQATLKIDEFVNSLNPVAFELLFAKSNSQVPLQMKQNLAGKSLIWHNTLWDSLVGGRDDDMALEDPDNAYGYLIEKLGARIIQTDRPQMLLDYLKRKGWK